MSASLLSELLFDSTVVCSLNPTAGCQQAFQPHQQPCRPNVVSPSSGREFFCFPKAAGRRHLECVRHEETVTACSRFLCCSLTSCLLSLSLSLSLSHTHTQTHTCTHAHEWLKFYGPRNTGGNCFNTEDIVVAVVLPDRQEIQSAQHFAPGLPPLLLLSPPSPLFPLTFL